MRTTAATATLILFAVVSLVDAAAPASRPSTQPVRPDPHLWTKRHLQVLRELAADERANAHEGFAQGLMFCFLNPLIVRDPYAGELLGIIDAAGEKPGLSEFSRGILRPSAAYLRMPPRERMLRAALRQMRQEDKDVKKDAVRAGRETDVAQALSELPPGPFYAEVIEEGVERLDTVARAAGNWSALAAAYEQLAAAALDHGETDRAAKYLDRLTALVRTHPESYRGGTKQRPRIALDEMLALLRRAGRADDADLLAKLPVDPLTADALIARATTAAYGGRLQDVRHIAAELRPLDASAAERLLAAAADDDAADAAAAEQFDDAKPLSDSLRGALEAITWMHARSGEVLTAGRQLAALQQGRSFHELPPGELASDEWANLARLAAEGGHRKAARMGFDLAVEALGKDPSEKPNAAEKSDFVRQAVALDRFDLAASVLRTSTAPGGQDWYGLARAYRERGDADRAKQLTDKAMAVARDDGDRGSLMTEMAVDLHAAGDEKRAEELLLGAVHHLDGVGFGFGVAGDIVDAACRTHRLDLLDQIYQTSEYGERMLLCIVASMMGVTDHS